MSHENHGEDQDLRLPQALSRSSKTKIDVKSVLSGSMYFLDAQGLAI